MTAPLHDLDAVPGTVATLHPDVVAEDLLEDARFALADTLAAAAHGLGGHIRSSVGPTGRSPGGEGSVRLWWTGRDAHLADATFANAHHAHSSDFDSVHYLTFGHPAAVSLPALLGLYESGVGSPRSVLVGYQLSVEVMAVAGARFGLALRAAGFHPTVVLGAPACAASCAWLLGGDAVAVEWAMAYAASTTIGFDTHFGSDIKALQVAACSRAGLHAAQLAIRRDGPGPRMPWYAPAATLAGSAPGGAVPHVFGRPWAAQLVPTRCKPLPICGYFDPVLAAWRVGQADLPEPRDVLRVTVEGPDYLVRANRFADPANLDEARFSLPFVVALLVHQGDVAPTDCVEHRLADASLRRTMKAVEVVPAPAGCPGVIRVVGPDREWRLPLRPSAADARTSWEQLEVKLVRSGLAGRASEVVAHVRAFEASTPARWRALVRGLEEEAA